jgi:hypothetical protein
VSPAALPARLVRSARARLADVRASPVLSATALREAWRARNGGHPADPDHGPHLRAAVEWLCRAQDAAGPDGGIARGYSLTWNAYFRAAGWQPPYPETTGYIIPTLFSAARALRDPGLAERAVRAARWEIAVQLPCGAVRGGVMGQPPSPAVFNTGQVMLGWLAATAETEDPAYAHAAARAGRWLAEGEEDGRFLRGNSRFARGDATAYNARAAWALAEAGAVLGEPALTDAAARVLRAVAAAQDVDGWFPDCCLHDPARPLLHTLAYTVRGLLEGGRVLGDDGLLRKAALAAGALAERMHADGWMSGRWARGWAAAADWSCVTGQAQMAVNWLRLREVTGDARWMEPAGRGLAWIKAAQDRAAPDAGARGGIPGSWPLSGDYGRYEILSWATKFFADGLMRHAHASGIPGATPVLPLA